MFVTKYFYKKETLFKVIVAIYNDKELEHGTSIGNRDGGIGNME